MRHTSIFATLSLLATVTVANGEDYVVAFPENMPVQMAESLTDAINEKSESMEPGDRMFVFTAGSPPWIIAKMEVTAQNRNRRRRELSLPLGQLNDYMMEHYAENSSEGATNIMLPQFLTELSTQTLASTNPDNRNVCILIVGNARYTDPRDETFSMEDGLFPSDGLIIASQSISPPYGTADRQGFLKGMNLHMAYTDVNWVSDIHTLRVQRTWWLFSRAQGGMLSTFTPDLSTAIERWANCDVKSGRSFTYDSTRDRQTMIRWTDAPPPVEEVAHDVPVEAETVGPDTVLLANDDWLRRDDITSASEQPENRSGSFKLGIRWGDGQNCSRVDMDLYVRSAPNLPFLYFRNKTSVDGRFNKDITATSQLGMANGMEYVDLTDISDIGSLQIMVNHYAGQCRGGVSGVVRAYFNGTVYETPFSTTSNDGSHGRYRRNAATSPYWAVVDSAELFNLN